MTRYRKDRRPDNDFLAQLVLWRNDPEQAEQIRHLAHTGQRDAQYALGLLYAEGRGLQQDEVRAYIWLTRAIGQGDQDARLLREIVQQSMTFEQIELAESRLSRQTTQ